MTLFAERAPQVTAEGPRTSFSVGRIGGGTSINSIPFESWMEVDMRSINMDKLREIDAVFQQAIQDVIVDAAAAMAALGLTPKLGLSSTDANIPISLGQPAITIGRGGVSKGAHSFEETWTDENSHDAIELALLITLAQAGLAEE